MYRLILQFETEEQLSTAEKFAWDHRAEPGSIFASASSIEADGLRGRDQRPELRIHIVRSANGESGENTQ